MGSTPSNGGGDNNGGVGGCGRRACNLTDNMFYEFNEIKNKKMIKETKLPHKLKWGDVFMKKPRAGAYYKYIKLKNIVHEES